MYVKSIELHINTNPGVIKVEGREAQRVFRELSRLEEVCGDLFESEDIDEDFTVKINDKIISMKEIANVLITPNIKANKVAIEIENMKQKIKETVLDVHGLHPLYAEEEENKDYIVWNADCWELSESGLTIGYKKNSAYEEDEEPLSVSSEWSSIIQLAKEFFALKEQLKQLLYA